MKSTKATVQQRVEEVLELRLAGAEFHQIRKYANVPDPQSGRKPWGVSDSQLWRYIRAGDELLAEILDKDRERLLNRHIAARRRLLSRAVAQNDLSNARALLKDEAELLGLYPPTKTQLTGKDGAPLIPPTPEKPLTDGERETAVANLLARLGAGRN